MRTLLTMYSLNDLPAPPEPEYGRLTATQNDATPTPKTPEIIQSLMSITSPLESYMKQQQLNCITQDRLFSPLEYISPDTCSSSSSNVDSPTSPAGVQNMCTQLIKEGLKLTLQKKRRNNASTSENEVCTPINNRPNIKYDESSMDTEEDDGSSSHGDANSVTSGLTAEDEERRKRRRERNKIAATKCRLKKRERTKNLVDESEELENQNQELKNRIQALQNQRKELKGMLSMHKPTCVNPSPDQSPVFDYQQPPSFAATNNNCIYDNSSSFATPVTSAAGSNFLSNTHPSLYDFTDSLINNPSIMLSSADDRRHYDLSYMDNATSSRCMV